ncbi:hypothetical protein BDZ89DRAFT_1136091 [Hymenopellis radicata]|nr:hypothetical protein BDZ89DRAFT_1136091 [Hymenopellis radicata]
MTTLPFNHYDDTANSAMTLNNIPIKAALSNSRRVIKMRIIYSISAGLITMLCTIASLVSILAWGHTFIYITFFFCIGRLYFNCLPPSTLTNGSALAAKELLPKDDTEHDAEDDANHYTEECHGRKRKASASPLQERPKKGEKTPEKRRFSKKSRFTLEEVGRRDELWVPYEVRRILEEGWKKPLRISMFTPEACLKEQNANLGEDVKHLKLNADGEMVATSKSSHSTDRVLGPGPWTAGLSNMARAVDRYYVPLTDKDGEPLMVSAAQMAKEFDTLRQECMRHPNFEQDFEVFKRYVEWAFRVHFQYELQVDVSVWNKAQFDTIAIEVEKEHRRALKKEINELKELAEKRAKDNARGGPKAPSGPRASSSSGTSQKTQGSQKSGGQKRSGKTYPCIYDNSTSHDTFDCPGGSSLIVHIPEGRPNGSFVDKKTGKKYCISWNQGQSCTRSICASGNIFLHACAICRSTEHCSRDHGKS